MSVKERDPLTGHLTTGHEWNGITELNTRVPRVIWFFIAVTHIWALGVWILLPSFPLVTTYTKGILGLDDQETVEEKVAAAEAARAPWADRIAGMPLEEIRADPALMEVVGATGPALYGDNCAACHGPEGGGGPGFPSLIDAAWLWGGTDTDVLETIRVGVNAPHPETRVSQMPAFGRDGVLTRDEIRAVEAYVLSLSGKAGDADPAALDQGKTLFADNCAVCHGADGKGQIDVGAPNLADGFWIYGGDEASVFNSVVNGHQGFMPSWEGRLSLVDRKILALHVFGMNEKAR